MQFPSQHTLLTPPPTIPPTRNPSPHHRTIRQVNPSPTPYTPNTTSDQFPAHPPVNHYRASQSPHQSGGDKRRRTTRGSLNSATTGPDTSPRNSSAAPAADRFRPPPIKPIGFAASREHRRQSGGYGEIPSPVVMGFDYKNVDAEQLKTVSLQTRRNTQPSSMPFPPFTIPPTPVARRNMPPPHSANTRNQAEALQVRATLSIKEQQEALIAQRRRDANQEQQQEAKGLTFKDWQPPSDKPRSMPQGKQSAAHLSVNTARNDDVIAASRVCSRLIRDATARLIKQSAPMGSLAAQQSGGRPGMMPPVQTRNGHLAPQVDPRAAPLGHSAEIGERPQYFRPSSGRYEVMPHTARPAPAERRSFTGPAGPVPSPHPNGHGRPEPMSPSAARREFLAPFERLYEVLASTEQTKFVLHDLHHRYESVLASKVKEIGDFKATTHAASTLLNNLQQSTDSLKDMVRYEISRATPKASGSGGLSSYERQEFEDLRARMKKMEEALEKKGEVETAVTTPKSHKRKKSGKETDDE